MTPGIVAIEMVQYELNIEVLIAFTVFYWSQKGHWTEQLQCLAIWLDRRLRKRTDDGGPFAIAM
jgi:hypothetical protein